MFYFILVVAGIAGIISAIRKSKNASDAARLSAELTAQMNEYNAANELWDKGFAVFKKSDDPDYSPDISSVKAALTIFEDRELNIILKTLQELSNNPDHTIVIDDCDYIDIPFKCLYEQIDDEKAMRAILSTLAKNQIWARTVADISDISEISKEELIDMAVNNPTGDLFEDYHTIRLKDCYQLYAQSIISAIQNVARERFQSNAS